MSRTIESLVKNTPISCLLLHGSVGFSWRAVEYHEYLWSLIRALLKKVSLNGESSLEFKCQVTRGTYWLASFLIRSIASYAMPLCSINSSSSSSHFLYFFLGTFWDQSCHNVVYITRQSWPRCFWGIYQFVRVQATTRSIHQGVSLRKMPLSPQKRNRLPTPLSRKKRRMRKIRKGGG